MHLLRLVAPLLLLSLDPPSPSLPQREGGAPEAGEAIATVQDVRVNLLYGELLTLPGPRHWLPGGGGGEVGRQTPPEPTPDLTPSRAQLDRTPLGSESTPPPQIKYPLGGSGV